MQPTVFTLLCDLGGLQRQNNLPLKLADAMPQRGGNLLHIDEHSGPDYVELETYRRGFRDGD